MTLVVSAGEPESSTTVSPGWSEASTVLTTGGDPCETSGLVALSTLRPVGVPYRLTVSDDEPTNVRSSSQCPVSLTNFRSTLG